jgi:hypothetical protein
MRRNIFKHIKVTSHIPKTCPHYWKAYSQCSYNTYYDSGEKGYFIGAHSLLPLQYYCFLLAQYTSDILGTNHNILQMIYAVTIE